MVFTSSGDSSLMLEWSWLMAVVPFRNPSHYKHPIFDAWAEFNLPKQNKCIQTNSTRNSLHSCIHPKKKTCICDLSFVFTLKWTICMPLCSKHHCWRDTGNKSHNAWRMRQRKERNFCPSWEREAAGSVKSARDVGVAQNRASNSVWCNALFRNSKRPTCFFPLCIRVFNWLPVLLLIASWSGYCL